MICGIVSGYITNRHAMMLQEKTLRCLYRFCGAFNPLKFKFTVFEEYFTPSNFNLQLLRGLSRYNALTKDVKTPRGLCIQGVFPCNIIDGPKCSPFFCFPDKPTVKFDITFIPKKVFVF